MRKAHTFVLTVILLAMALGGPAQAADPKPEEKPPTDLATLSWMVGDWQGTTPEGDFNQEVWLAAKGDSMMGLWRMVSASGGVGLFEFITVIAEKDGIVMRLRHVDRAGVSREKADKPVVLRLARVTAKDKEKEAVFSGGTGKTALTVTYRSPAPGELHATVEKPTGKEEFRFKRTVARP